MFTSKMYHHQSGHMTVVVEGSVYNVSKTNPNYAILLQAYKDNDSETFVKNVDIKQAMSNYLDTQNSNLDSEEPVIVLNHDSITYNGEKVSQFLTDTILSMSKMDMCIKPMINFLKNLMLNPSYNSKEQLFKFLENKNMPITDDGCFVAYKTVTKYDGEDFTDVHGNLVTKGSYIDKYSKSVRNNIGDKPIMDRNNVDDNSSNHCSKGYHVGALSYAGPGGWYNSVDDVVVLVKVNPKDAVSVPSDHSFTKLRVCEYEVIDTFKQALTNIVFNGSNQEVCEYDEDNYDEDEYEDEYEDECDEDECDEEEDEDDYDEGAEETQKEEFEKQITYKIQNLQKNTHISTKEVAVSNLKYGLEYYIFFSADSCHRNGIYYAENPKTLLFEDLKNSEMVSLPEDEITHIFLSYM